MNHIRVTTTQATTWSSTPCWQAMAIINGQLTTCRCGHSHSSEALALKCANGKFALQMAPFTFAEIVRLENGAHEARWTDKEGRQVASRFRFCGVSADA